MRALLLLAGLSALAPLGAAAAALIGLGVVRELPPAQVAAAASLGTILPVAGIWALGNRETWALVAGAWIWPVLLLLGLPGYFPGEVPGAIGTGFAVVAAPGGPDLTARAAQLGERVGAPVATTAPKGEAPPDEAERALPDCVPAAVAAPGDQVALPYEGTGHSLAIPVQFGDVELPMLFDTGATVTTLNRASLRKLGVDVPPDAPEITLRTANGERKTRLVLVPRVWVGGLPVDGVTVGVCEECADGRTVGLLGLNVSSQFLVTVDTQRKEVVFQAREGAQERLIDVQPWLDVTATATMFPDRRVEVEVTAANNATRAVASAEVGVTCGDDRFAVKLADVAPGERARKTASLPRGSECRDYRVTLDRARW
ncbi:MAG: retropepsin-like aspartic protease family protein [Myxococcota bacterium]